jgi:hypothetical protein
VDEEARSFKASGRADRVFPLIVDGEPYASERALPGQLECFPPSLRLDVSPDGTLTDRRAEPVAADARKGKDGRANACLKLIAGILNVHFDELRQRERTRQRQRRRWFAGAAAAAAVALVATYVGLADAEFAVPAGAALLRQIDRCACSVFRRIPSATELAQAASLARNRIRQKLTEAIGHGDVVEGAAGSTWTIGQVSAAIFRDPDAGAADFRLITPMLARVFNSDLYAVSDGRPIGWRDIDFYTRVEPVLWTMMAIAAAVGRSDALAEPEREQFLRDLHTAQEMAEAYYPLRNGGWNDVAILQPEQHYLYATGLALHALVELHAAGLCWRGSCGTLRDMIAETSR